MGGNKIVHRSVEDLLRQIDFLKDQIKKLAAEELHQYKLQEKLDFQLKTQQEIVKLGYKIQTVHDEKEIAAIITETLVEGFEYEKAMLFFGDEVSGKLTLAGMEGYYGKSSEELIGESFSDLLAITEDHTMPDLLIQHNVPPSAIAMDDRVVLVCRSKSGIIHCLIVFGNSRDKSAYHRAINEQDRGMCKTISSMVSAAFENIYLYRQLDRERENLKKAHDSLRNLNDELEKIVLERTAELADSREEYRLLYLESERTSRQFRSLIDSAADPIVVCDDKGIPIYVNPAFVRVFGWQFAEVKNEKIDFVPPGVEKETSEIIGLITGKKEISNLETKRKTKDGRIRDVSISAAAHFDEQGRYAGSVFQLRDITERKLLEAELLKMHKLESTGLLAGGIAHDFNNILSAILMNTQMALINMENPAMAAGFLRGVEAATGRAEKLARQLLTFAKGGTPVKKLASLEKFVREVVEFVLHGSNVKCEFDIADNLWPAEIDEGQMNQVIQNLIINARQAMPLGGVIRISLANVTFNRKPERELLGSDQEKDNFVMISIRDDGVGIQPENLGKIFDPYFTTKEKNVGLGLSTTHSIVTRHNGRITVKSEAGLGSTFSIYLPASKGTPVNINQKSAQQREAAGSGCVLVMDDEKMIRELMAAILQSMGYEVAQAQDGHEAIDLYIRARQAGKPHDLVIMDLTIPGGMGGKETIAELTAINPDIKAIVSSGYSNDPIMADYKKYGFCGVLKKPFKIDELKDVLFTCKEKEAGR